MSKKEITKYLNLTGKKISSKDKKKIIDVLDYMSEYRLKIIEIKFPEYFNFYNTEDFTNEIIVKIKKEDIFGIILSKDTPSILSYILGLKSKETNEPAFLLYLNSNEKEGFECDDPSSFITPEKELYWLKKSLENKHYNPNELKNLKKRISLLEIKKG